MHCTLSRNGHAKFPVGSHFDFDPRIESRDDWIEIAHGHIKNYLSNLRARCNRDDPGGSLPVLLRMPGIQSRAPAKGRGLLRLLLLR
jgi:hypothetical protein